MIADLDANPEDPHLFEGVSSPDVSHLITEDDTPVDSLFSEMQMRLLVESLYTSWQPGVPFVAMANVGVFVAPNRPPVVPDVLVTTEVSRPANLMQKEHRSYFTWLFDGKSPDIVIEVVSNRIGGELTRKMREYAHIRTPWYAIFDPARLIQNDPLVIYSLDKGEYHRSSDPALPFGLQFRLWEGKYEGQHETWLRWADAEGKLLLSGAESARLAEQKARSTEEKAKALAAKLRELGVDPDSLG